MICYLHHHHQPQHGRHGCRLLWAMLQRQLCQSGQIGVTSDGASSHSRSGNNQIHNNKNKLFLSNAISSLSTNSAPVSNNIKSTTSTFGCPHNHQQQQQQTTTTSEELEIVAKYRNTSRNYFASWRKRIFKQQPTTAKPLNHYCDTRIIFKSLLVRRISTTTHHYPQVFPSSERHLSSKSKNNINTMEIAQIISGKEVADEIRSKLKEKVTKLTVRPKLVIVQVGGREDSNVYIRMKIQFAESIGAVAELIKLDRNVSQVELAKTIDQLNKDKAVHGIITQLPFDCSQKIDSDAIVNRIDPSKDVDGLSVYNAGKLSHGELNSSSFIPCTPNGCMELIRKSGIQIEGSKSVVIGRSKIVGSPMAQLLLWNNSTVTICHSKTKNIDQICREADIVVAAVGRAQMVKKDWLKPGAVVIDCGINVIPDASKKSGTRLVGDVDFEECKQVASAITPVPGGVGPMTVAMLIANTVESAIRVDEANKQQ